LFEAGEVLGEPRFQAAAKLAADALLAQQRPDGSLSGQFDSEWNDSATWSCLTGDAQTAIVWLRLHEKTGDARYLVAARRINRYLSSTQDLIASDPGIRGGVRVRTRSRANTAVTST
jgi:uncharacterized protein YyaL (SSP411 family)